MDMPTCIASLTTSMNIVNGFHCLVRFLPHATGSRNVVLSHVPFTQSVSVSPLVRFPLHFLKMNCVK